MILLRVLRADLRRYNAQRDEEGNDVLEVRFSCCFRPRSALTLPLGNWLEAGSC